MRRLTSLICTICVLVTASDTCHSQQHYLAARKQQATAIGYADADRAGTPKQHDPFSYSKGPQVGNVLAIDTARSIIIPGGTTNVAVDSELIGQGRELFYGGGNAWSSAWLKRTRQFVNAGEPATTYGEGRFEGTSRGEYEANTDEGVWIRVRFGLYKPTKLLVGSLSADHGWVGGVSLHKWTASYNTFTNKWKIDGPTGATNDAATGQQDLPSRGIPLTPGWDYYSSNLKVETRRETPGTLDQQHFYCRIKSE